MYKMTRKALLIASGLFISTSAWAGDIATGEMLANTCAGCHGTNGVSMGPATPSIAGMSTSTLEEAMKGYRSGDRPSTIMGRIAKAYNDDEIAAMAAHLSKQSYAPAKQDFDQDKADDGEKLHGKYCKKCHEDGGRTDEETSIIAGQWKPYLTYTFQDFQSGSREMPKKMKKAMKKMHKKAGDEGVTQLIEYYASQQDADLKFGHED
jgi:sulfide dehydrogenase cytochrome subunit